MKEIIESAIDHIDETFPEFNIHLTLETALILEEIQKIIEDMLFRFTQSSYIREWCRIDNKLTTYRCSLTVLSKFEGIEVTKLIKVFDKICPRFKLCGEYWNFGCEYLDIEFDIKDRIA